MQFRLLMQLMQPMQPVQPIMHGYAQASQHVPEMISATIPMGTVVPPPTPAMGILPIGDAANI